MIQYIKNQWLWHKIKNANLLTGDVDNNIFKNRLKAKYKWTEEKCDDLISQYKQFLFIAATSNESETPTQEVDEVWHEHILFTRDYFDDWTKILGKTIHHAPDKVIDEEKTEKVFAKTQSKLDALDAKLKTRLKTLEQKKPQRKRASSTKRSSSSAYSNSNDGDLTNNLLMYSMLSDSSGHHSPSSDDSPSLPAEAPPATSHCSSSSSHCSSSSSSCSSASSCSSSSCGSSGD
jgi:hypothetical protein